MVRLLQVFRNYLDDPFKVLVDILIRESQEMDTKGFNIALTDSITLNLPGSRVCCPINLHCKLARRTVEVDDVLGNPLLSAELEAQQLTVFESRPEDALRGGGGIAQTLTKSLLILAIVDSSHSP